MRIAFKLLQCIEKIIATDGRREQQFISGEEIQNTITAIKTFASHPICDADRPSDGTDGIPSKVEKLVKKFQIQLKKRMS